MNVFQLHSRRNRKHTVLLSLLLAVAVGISSIAFTTWLGVLFQHSRLNKHYTTIAVPEEMPYMDATAALPSIVGVIPHDIQQDENKYPSFYGEESFSIKDVEGNTHYFPGPRDVAEVVATAPNVISMDRRILLSAYVEGMTALTSGTLDELDYQVIQDEFCYNGCVAAVECVMVEQDPSSVYDYRFRLRILDWVSRSQAYDLPEYDDTIYMETRLHNSEGTALFEVGKTYLVRGFYKDYTIATTPNGEKQRMLNQPDSRKIYLPETQNWHSTLLRFSDPEFQYESQRVPMDDGTEKTVLCVADSGWPVVSEYSGSWEDFLETEDGRIWAEEIIPTMETGHSSAPVILTDHVESMYNFVIQDAVMVEGRTFTQEEYTAGNLVCMVSDSYARANNLQLGDKITLDFYNSGYKAVDLYHTVTWMRSPMLERHRLDIRQEYEIVGTYYCPGFGGSMYDFGEDTIFVPKNSVPNWEQYDTENRYPFLDTVVIENGSIGEMEAFLAEHHMDGYFYYEDQGYTKIQEAVQTVKNNALWILMIGLMIFIPGSLVFVSLKMKPYRVVIHSLRRLGIDRKTAWRQCMQGLMTLTILPVILGTAGGAMFYEFVVRKILQIQWKLQISEVLLCGGFCFVFLLCAGGIFACWAVGYNLMNGKQVKK